LLDNCIGNLRVKDEFKNRLLPLIKKSLSVEYSVDSTFAIEVSFNDARYEKVIKENFDELLTNENKLRHALRNYMKKHGGTRRLEGRKKLTKFKKKQVGQENLLSGALAISLK
jgi:hypothetical protein